MFKKIALIATMIVFPAISFAEGQYIAANATVKKVSNTAGNGSSFSIVVTGGSGPCISNGTQVNIYFPKNIAGTEKVFDRAYSSALAALISGKKVNIYNYIDGTCSTAAAIELMAD